MSQRKTHWNLYFAKTKSDTVRSRYYVGDEDGIWPAELVRNAQNKWIPRKTSNIMIPFYWIDEHLIKVKPQGMLTNLKPEREPDFGFSLDELEASDDV